MSNRTIYVSQNDEKLFEQAKEIAGEALSSVIARSLREYVARNSKKADGMKEISVKVGSHDSEREQRFIGARIGEWKGFSDDKKWYMKAEIYRTKKENFAILLETLYPAALITNKRAWKNSSDFMLNTRRTELIVEKTQEALRGKIPTSLLETISDLAKKYENPVEYLDI
ncbi:MAG TPA: EXLDI protein [Patescibacteria group bacterium]|nr:EXLDI protein [Patescibacteria group bacterium]